MLIQEPLSLDRLFYLLPVVMTGILLIANFQMLQTLELWAVSSQKCMQDSRSVFIIRIRLIKKWTDFPSKYFLRADDHSKLFM